MAKLKCCNQCDDAFLGPTEDMWTPYKHLNAVLQRNLCHPTEFSVVELEAHLKKYKPSFSSLLLYPQKNEKTRQLLKNGLFDGVSISKYSRTVPLSKELIDEAIIISDMFNIDEIISLELLCTAQRQVSQHPGLSRGLIAVLLYYDGRKALTYSLRDLFRATTGVAWDTDIPKEITSLVSTFTQALVNNFNILERIVYLLDELDVSKEIALLTKNRALGSKKHQNQVQQLYIDIKMALATTLFNWSAQRGLSKGIVIKLIKNISNFSQMQASGLVDDVTLTVLMALLYSCDTSTLLKYETSNAIIQNIPILSQGDFLETVHDALTSTHQDGINGILKLAFGLALTGFRHSSQNVPNSSSKIIAHDERLIDMSITCKVFDFIYYSLLENKILYRQPFFYRRIHMLLTDFIEFMHSKVTELRGKADETARTVMGFLKEGLEPPYNLDHSFEMLMLCISKFYKDNRAGLSLCVEFWEPLDSTCSSLKTTTRSVSLFKFIRLAGELLPSTLFVSYLKMIAGLTSCERSARNTFNLLKQASGLTGSSTLSWEHFFGSLIQYYSNLRQEHCLGGETSCRIRLLNRCINPQEIEALQAVLEVIRAVANYDELARISICEHPNWAPIHILLGLLSCPVPLELKANILQTLSALSKSKETATILWDTIETSQIIPTVPTTNSNNMCNLIFEITQTECRLESYPLSQGILDLIYSLIRAYIPNNLGADHRKPGIHPYIMLVIDGIFLKFYDRQYKNSTEKWQIGVKSLQILNYLIHMYEPKPSDFEELDYRSTPLGYYIMLLLQKKTTFLHLLLQIIDEARLRLDEYETFNEKATLEECALLCLMITEEGLLKQKEFLNAHVLANNPTLLFGLNKILLDVNPRSQRPDHLINISKFVMYCSWIPNHSLAAVNILNMVSRMPNVATQILEVFISNGNVYDEIRQGFVDCLDMELNDNTYDESDIFHKRSKTGLKIKTSIIDFLRNCISQPAPNIGFYLLGFETTNDAMERQKLSITDTTKHCIKSLIVLLDNHLETMRTSNSYDADIEQIIERSYFLVYLLCSNFRTSEAMLRYLRSSNDFICRHLRELPLKNVKYSYILHQTSYLLECTAIELKLSTSYSQISRVQQLCEILVGTTVNKTDNNIGNDSKHFLSHSLPAFDENFIKSRTEKVQNYLLSSILDSLHFEMRDQNNPKWDFFDVTLSKQIFDDCESSTDDGYSLIDIQKLHNILNDELCTVQSTVASGQRKLILQEIESILLHALKINEVRNQNKGTIQVMAAWVQVTEILFICVSESTLPYSIKQELLFEMLQKLLNKVVSVQTAQEISILASETVFILLVCLRQCFVRKPDNTGIDGNKISYLEKTKKERNVNNISSDSNILNLKSILKRILQWIVTSSVTSQKLRINLYAAALTSLRILNGHISEHITLLNNESFVSRLDNEFKTPINSISMQVPVELFSSFGDKLIDIICHDCVIGHDICKMLAMSCFVSALEFHPIPNIMRLFLERGYLANIIDNLEQSDDDLCQVVCESVKNIKALYVYESHMALLLRFASCSAGAEMLLSGKLMGVLSKMKVFDMHPDFQGHLHSQRNSSEFLPTADSRFRQILFPALHLCNTLVSTLGTENQSAMLQIVCLLFSHFEMIEFVLRAGISRSDLGILQELSAITGIVARIIKKEIWLPVNLNAKHNGTYIHKINRHMLHVFCYFVLNNDILKRNIKTDAQIFEVSATNWAYITHFVDITANVTIFFRNKVTQNINLNDIIFTPKTKPLLKRNESNRTINESLDFATVLIHLQGSVEYLEMQKRISDNVISHKSSMSEESIDDSVRLVCMEWMKQYEYRQTELSPCIFIIEQTLYLLWIHLDFYVKSMTNTASKCVTICSSEERLQDSITTNDIILLKQNLISVFNETFCSYLLTACGSEKENYFSFTLVRRIKSLIQLLPCV